MKKGRFPVILPLLACALLSLVPAPAVAAECPLDDTNLCLQAGRFQVQVSWTDHDGNSGEGRAYGITDDTGAFWFFGPTNLELMVKVLDGRAVNGHFWVFYGALSNVDYTLTVIDTTDGTARTYHNPAGRLASRADTEAFPDPLSPIGTTSLAKIAAASTLPGSPEFRVNINTQGAQRHPSLAIDGAGNVMVVWVSDHDDLAVAPALYGRIYDAQGNPRTGEFLVAESKAPSSFVFGSKVAANPVGEFLVVWDQGGLVLARRFGANGQPLGPEIRLNTATTTAGPPDVARRPQGGFVVVWPDANGVRALPLDEQGNPAGPEINVAPATPQVGEPRVSVSSAGNFVVTWGAAGTAVFEDDVWARRFDANGHPQGGPILVNGVAPYQAGHQSGAIPVALPDGGFTVVWEAALFFREGRLGVFSRHFPSGLPPGEVQELHAPGTLPHLSPLALALDDLGRILLLWSGDGPGDDNGVFGRILRPTGLPNSDIFLVNLFKGEAQTEPAVAASPTGGFVAVWSSGSDYPSITPIGNEGLSSQDGHFFGVFGRRFTALCSDEANLCLAERFRVQVTWTDHDGNTGVGHAVPLTTDTGAFWFFGEENLELMIKLLDGRPVNGHFWVFYGALSDVRYTLTVTDMTTGATKTYTNPAGRIASRADTEAFRVE